MKILLFGSTGWIGHMVHEYLINKNHQVVNSKLRISGLEKFYNELLEELNNENPDIVFNCAGITGSPNVDWCESHINETFDCNVLGMITMMNTCRKLKIPLVHFSSGCIYCNELQDLPPLENVYKYTEKDVPNFTGSVYSLTRYLIEFFVLEDYKNHNSEISILDNTLILRIRMPIVDVKHPKNLITKILNYPKLIEQYNSISFLPELLPIGIEMGLNGKRGIYNFTNPGAITHPWIVSQYNKIKNVKDSYKIISIEEQNNFLKSKRSTCILDTTKLEDTLKELNQERMFRGEQLLILSDAKTAIIKSLEKIILNENKY